MRSLRAGCIRSFVRGKALEDHDCFHIEFDRKQVDIKANSLGLSRINLEGNYVGTVAGRFAESN